MKKIYLLVVFILFYNAVAAQVTLQGNPSFTTIRDLDSANAEAAAIMSITMDRPELIVLSASDSGLGKIVPSDSVNKGPCVIAFIGCDESHNIMSDFTNYFYSEYFKTSNKEASFLKAKSYLFNKYPDSPVTPVMNCGK